jgi:hypothetical protein
MHPLDTKILKHEFGTYANFPPMLNAPIIALQESTIDAVLSIYTGSAKTMQIFKPPPASMRRYILSVRSKKSRFGSDAVPFQEYIDLTQTSFNYG